jgi:hypothetical protein
VIEHAAEGIGEHLGHVQVRELLALVYLGLIPDPRELSSHFRLDVNEDADEQVAAEKLLNQISGAGEFKRCLVGHGSLS